jgi:hypothetical protein
VPCRYRKVSEARTGRSEEYPAPELRDACADIAGKFRASELAGVVVPVAPCRPLPGVQGDAAGETEHFELT